VQAQILRDAPHLHDNGIHLLISPTPYGELIIGDSHHYGSDPSPFNAEQVDDWMIGWPNRRWAARCKWSSAGRVSMVHGGRGRFRSCARRRG
jgi:hypothetical protein